MTDGIPVSIHQSTLTIAGVEIVVHQLDDGRRVIEGDGVARVLEAMAAGTVSEAEAHAFAEATR